MIQETYRANEAQELAEYLQTEKEWQAARKIEAAEFIRDNDDTSEKSESASDEIQDAPAEIIRDHRARRSYWQAQALVEMEQDAFALASAQNDDAHQRAAYFRLAVYHGRTLSILRAALADAQEALAQAAMRNLATLHRAMQNMHSHAPNIVPPARVLDRAGRDQFARDLVMRVLSGSSEPLDAETIAERANALNETRITKGTVTRHLKDLAEAGYVENANDAYAKDTYMKTACACTQMDASVPAMRALFGQDLYAKFDQAGFARLEDALARQSAFRETFCRITALSETSAALCIDLIATLLEGHAPRATQWNFTDLIGSPYPRPYQYEAYAVFRGYGFHGQLVEAPTGSGKTMIGMMCVQDWLGKLRAGQSILILVPTSNYLQQWAGELCYKPIGLRLSPEMVFAGTPGQLERFQKRTGSHPAILLMTYTSLAQSGSGIGKGGFDVDSIEMFLQGANVQYVVLDEVHKVVENLESVSSDVIRLMLEWMNDGSVQALIGFTGTAEAYRARFAKLGLQLVYSIPMDELIAAGFVAPFAEAGAPFSYSARERRIRELLDAYKDKTLEFMALVGGENLRAWFAEIPMEQRVHIGYELLNMYHGRSDWQASLSNRFSEWETGERLKLTEAKLVSLVQIARKWSDAALIQNAGADAHAFANLVAELNELRAQLAQLIYLPSTLKRLNAANFTTALDVPELRAAFANAANQVARAEAVQDSLATTIVGLYEGTSDWSRRVGEGRVETIKTIIEAERASRAISGTIIFDTAHRIPWKQGVSAPGYQGVGGLYAQLLGDERFMPYAVLSGEQYLPYDENDPLPPRIARFIETEMMQGEIGSAMFDLVCQGLELSDTARANLRLRWRTLLEDYIPRLENVHAARPGDFSRRVLRPMRKRVRELDLGYAGERLLTRLDLRNLHFADLVNTFFDYAIIARYFRHAQVAELEQVSGARQKFFVIPMAAGNRKLLMYDLTSRIVDAESLPINLIIVSGWARTGWNVISPNLLIDATATRDVTAWQQLRGRAIRARRTWTNDCYRLIMLLIGSRMHSPLEQADMPEEVASVLEEITSASEQEALDERLKPLLRAVVSDAEHAQIAQHGFAALSDAERTRIAIALMRRFNKVTHIYELVKAYGATSQVEYNRPEKIWQRRENITAKHEYELAVNLFTGQKLTGDAHAPLLYADDPRTDVPQALQKHLTRVIENCDDVIVAGWLQDSLSPAPPAETNFVDE